MSSVDIHFYYQNENITLNTMNLFILCKMFQAFLSAIIRLNHNNINGKVQ